MYINTFKYTPKDVSCQLCTEYVKKLGCTALRCPWLAERIEALGVRAKTLCFDVRDQQQVFDVCGSLEADWAEIDVLINNAGLALGLDPLEASGRALGA